MTIPLATLLIGAAFLLGCTAQVIDWCIWGRHEREDDRIEDEG